ncbi:hypothetical protein ACTHQZ_08120 [Methylorubrum thiocyanatum]
MAVGYGRWLIVLTKVGEDEWSAMAYGPGGQVGGRYGAALGNSDLSSVLAEAKGFIDGQPQPQSPTSVGDNNWTIELTGDESGWRAIVTQLTDSVDVGETFKRKTHDEAIEAAESHIGHFYSRGLGM